MVSNIWHLKLKRYHINWSGRGACLVIISHLSFSYVFSIYLNFFVLNKFIIQFHLKEQCAYIYLSKGEQSGQELRTFLWSVD